MIWMKADYGWALVDKKKNRLGFQSEREVDGDQELIYMTRARARKEKEPGETVQRVEIHGRPGSNGGPK